MLKDTNHASQSLRPWRCSFSPNTGYDSPGNLIMNAHHMSALRGPGRRRKPLARIFPFLVVYEMAAQRVDASKCMQRSCDQTPRARVTTLALRFFYK